MNNNSSLWQKLFGIFQKQDEKEDKLTDENIALELPQNNDGAVDVEVIGENQVGSLAYSYDGQIEPKIENTKQLIGQYRQLMMNFEVDDAVQEIVDDAIVYEDNIETVYLDLEDTDFSEKIKERISEEFSKILTLYDFEKKGADLFKRWYVDSRLYFEKITNPNNKSEGIKELRQLDPKCIELIRKYVKKRTEELDVIENIREVFVYTPENNVQYGFFGGGYSSKKVEIPKSSIVYSHSGELSPCGKNIIGFLHRAIRPANQLKMLEDSLIIYRVTRAPERRVWYIGVGNLNNKAATQYVNNIAQSFKNKAVYDSSTGRVKTQSNNLTMSEDFYLQRRGDGSAKTEVQPLAGASNLGEITDVEMFRRNLYMALRVPLSRIPRTDGGITIGNNGEAITRDELKFAKFIRTLRKRFSVLLTDPLGTNLIMKNIITVSEWEENKNNIKVVYNNDSYFDEAKDIELLRNRLSAVAEAEPVVGKYMSHDTLRKMILKQSDEQIKYEDELIKAEKDNEIFYPKEEEFNIGNEQ